MVSRPLFSGHYQERTVAQLLKIDPALQCNMLQQLTPRPARARESAPRHNDP